MSNSFSSWPLSEVKTINKNKGGNALTQLSEPDLTTEKQKSDT